MTHGSSKHQATLNASVLFWCWHIWLKTCHGSMVHGMTYFFSFNFYQVPDSISIEVSVCELICASECWLVSYFTAGCE